MRSRFAFVPIALAAAFLGALALPAAGAPHFTLHLAHPMRAGNVRLDPGDYEVRFEAAPSGPPRFVAVFLKGGARVATAPDPFRTPVPLKATPVKK